LFHVESGVFSAQDKVHSADPVQAQIDQQGTAGLGLAVPLGRGEVPRGEGGQVGVVVVQNVSQCGSGLHHGEAKNCYQSATNPP